MNTRNLEDLYEKIANTVNQMIPEEWTKVLIEAEIWSKNDDKKNVGRTSVGFYYLSEKSKEYIFAYNIEDMFQIDTDNFEELRDRLYAYCNEMWKEFVNQGQEPWSRFTLMVTNEGKMKIDFAYDDLYELYENFTSDEIEEMWKEKYLK
ncbi:MAG: DUF600 family protein [Fusobacteriaceae bacterium]|nr:DUF600 family protein [Fusobacteriaceae bacterium]